MKDRKVKSQKFGKKNNAQVPYDSEAVRLASLKKQKQAFRQKEQVIRDALNSAEGSTINNKVIFDDETIEAYEKNTNVVKKQKQQLFDEDDDDDDDTELNFSEKPKVVTLGNDERFTLGRNFLEDDEEAKPGDNHEQVLDEFTEEKKKQLEILQSVVGKPIQPKIARPTIEKKNSLYRYDPTVANDEDYEEEKEVEEKPARKKKRKIEKEKTVEEEAPVPVSSDVFFSVSNNLTDALKSNEEFSLLKSFGAVVEPENTDDNNRNSMKSIQSSMSYDLPSKNPFKYDSTDDENENFNDASGAKKSKTQIDVNENVKDTFFFAIKDPRFKDAETFFKSQAVTTESFNNVRRELKQIVRKKIRNNAKKNQPMKKKIQTMKKRPRKN